jgi:hypothetical protein
MSINPMQSAHDAPRCKAKSYQSRTGHSADKGSADSSGQSHQGKACLIGIQLSGKLWMGA